ncbi:hypothetical protein OIO90_004099 [Microbotryomycetes sp. JL221]|nr:hypothetical protein OIO90_004099 [Microbotryomycetes sp. JL221]
MPLYELVCIAARNSALAPIRALTTTASSLIVKNGGVVRTFDYWGNRHLPQPFKRGQDSPKAVAGDYWTMKFDANPPTVAALRDRLRLDPRVLRWTVLKVGSTLEQVIEPTQDKTVKMNRFDVLSQLDKPQATTRQDQSHRTTRLPGQNY